MRSLFSPFKNKFHERIHGKKSDKYPDIGFVDKKWGYLSMVAAMVFFGISSTFNKILLSDIHPTALAALT